MSEPFEKASQEAAAFQKLWLENCAKTMQAALSFTPDSAPPDVLRQIRSGIFQSLAESWDQYMRSPQFLNEMRQWMDNAVAFRKISNEFMGRIRNDLQAPSRSDIDTVLLAVRHMEQRLLDRLDELPGRLNGAAKGASTSKAPAPHRKRRSKSKGTKTRQSKAKA